MRHESSPAEVPPTQFSGNGHSYTWKLVASKRNRPLLTWIVSSVVPFSHFISSSMHGTHSLVNECLYQPSSQCEQFPAFDFNDVRGDLHCVQPMDPNLLAL